MASESPYNRIKENQQKTNPFFGKIKEISSINDNSYFSYFDLISHKLYSKKYVTSQGLTKPTEFFLDEFDNKLYDFHEKGDFIETDTYSQKFLIRYDKRKGQGIEELEADCYKLYANYYGITSSKAVRDVNASDRQIHWVWFRKEKYYLTEEIYGRAMSWVELNPGYTFHFWTSIKDSVELADFLSKISATNSSNFISKTTVHYAKEFEEEISNWFASNLPDLSTLLHKIWNSKERQDIVMKTDYTRNIIICIHGGIYADFNDLLCLRSIEPVLSAHAGMYIGVSDTDNQSHSSNYFMYSSAKNPEFTNIVKACTSTMPEVYSMIHSCETLEKAKGIAVHFLHGEENTYELASHESDFVRAVLLALQLCMSRDDSSVLEEILKVPLYRRKKNEYLVKAIEFLKGKSIKTDEFEIQWRFAYTHMYLSEIMYKTNLPIYCHEQQIPLYLLPFSYLLRFGCFLSFIGHLGDGSSYGKAAVKKAEIADLIANMV